MGGGRRCDRGGHRAPRLGGLRGEHVFPRRQGVAPAVLAAVPQHPGHDREEGGPLRLAAPPDLAAAHRVAAGAREARARAVERGGGAPPAAAFAARALLVGSTCLRRTERRVCSHAFVDPTSGAITDWHLVSNLGLVALENTYHDDVCTRSVCDVCLREDS